MRWILLLAALVAGGDEPKQKTYDEAAEEAQRSGRPLLVIVGAEWCPSCKVVKQEASVLMKDDSEFKDVILYPVDLDKSPEIASKIMRGKTLPQIIVFRKRPDGWKRFSLDGVQTGSRLKELLKRSGQ